MISVVNQGDMGETEVIPDKLISTPSTLSQPPMRGPGSSPLSDHMPSSPQPQAEEPDRETTPITRSETENPVSTSHKDFGEPETGVPGLASHDDSGGSEDEGRLHIATNILGKRSNPSTGKAYEDDLHSDAEEDFVEEEEEEEETEDFFEENERTIRQHLYNQHRQQQAASGFPRGAFDIGNLTVTKFPLNGHGQSQQAGSFGRSHHHRSSSGSQFMSGNLLKRDRDGMPVSTNIILNIFFIILKT